MDDLQPASTSTASTSLPEFEDVIGSLFVEVEVENENSKVEAEVENSTVSLERIFFFKWLQKVKN